MISLEDLAPQSNDAGWRKMKGMLEPLEERRKIVDRKATEFREERDKWNHSTKEHLTARNGLNAQVRELIEEAARQRELREQKNELVRAAKESRAEKNEQLKAAKEKLFAVRGGGDKGDDSAPNLHQMKREMKVLEDAFNIGRFGGKKAEKEYMEKMKGLSRKVRELEREEKNNTELAEAQEAHKKAADEQEEAHEAVTKAAEQAQSAHELMVRLHKEVDKLRNEADDAQKKLSNTKKQADRNHRFYINCIRALHSIQDLLKVDRNRMSLEADSEARDRARQDASDIMAKLMSGQTLSTEELMALQREDN